MMLIIYKIGILRIKLCRIYVFFKKAKNYIDHQENRKIQHLTPIIGYKI